MQNIGRKLEIFVIVSVIALIGIIYAFTQKPALAPTSSTVATDQNSTPNTGASVRPNPNEAPPPVQVPSNVVQYAGVDGKNAFELLNASHRVEAKHYSFGDMVTSIDGIEPDANHFWAMYVNGQFSQVGASSYITKNSDTIKWQIDAVVDTTK